VGRHVSPDFCFSELTLENSTKRVGLDYKNPTKRIGLEQSGPYHHLIEN
jgi:hypothetical protein